MQSKVKETRMHTYPSIKPYQVGVPVSCPVAEGKLVLIDRGPRSLSNESALLFKVPDSPGYSGRFGIKKDIVMSPSEWNSGDCLDPIIISETQQIEVGDWVYGGNKPSIIQVRDDSHLQYLLRASEAYPQYKFFVVLTLPEHFSPKHLQAIVDGKMKDGDKVLVECEEDFSAECIESGKCNCKGNNDKCTKTYDYKIKLNSSNHITLHKVEQQKYTLEEMKRICWNLVSGNPNTYEGTWTSLCKWFEQNVK